MQPSIELEKNKLKGVFVEAASLIFHKEMLPEFLEGPLAFFGNKSSFRQLRRPPGALYRATQGLPWRKAH